MRKKSLLDDYGRKRDFRKTAEPSASARPARRGKSNPIFVVQEHHATHLHYDFRLEADSVLKSWAVPKEPTLDPTIKRLAIHVEDHPLAYANFTGDIPKGQYGGGHVEIWDRGTFENTADKSVTKSIEAGKVEVELHGKKLKGAFVLVRAFGRGGGKDNWLLMKRNDAYAIRGESRAITTKGAGSKKR